MQKMVILKQWLKFKTSISKASIGSTEKEKNPYYSKKIAICAVRASN
jgi:hypothetical protein